MEVILSSYLCFHVYSRISLLHINYTWPLLVLSCSVLFSCVKLSFFGPVAATAVPIAPSCPHSVASPDDVDDEM